MIVFLTRSLNTITTILLAALFAGPAFAVQPVLVSSVAHDSQNGPDAHILKAVAAKMNHRIFFHNAPFKRRLIMMKNGDIDLICGLLKRPERETYIHFIPEPYKTLSHTVFFVPPGQAGSIRSYRDLQHLKIGTVLGAKFFPRFDNDTELNKDMVHQHSVNFSKLILGRIDTLISNEAGGIAFIDKMGIAGQVEMAEYRIEHEKSVYFGLSKKSRFMGQLNTIEKVIQDMIYTGEIGQIFTGYYTSRHLPVPAFH